MKIPFKEIAILGGVGLAAYILWTRLPDFNKAVEGAAQGAYDASLGQVFGVPSRSGSVGRPDIFTQAAGQATAARNTLLYPIFGDALNSDVIRTQQAKQAQVTASTAKPRASYLGATVITPSGYKVSPSPQYASFAAGTFIKAGAPQITTSAQGAAALMGKSYAPNVAAANPYQQVSSFTAKGDSRSYVYQNVGGVVQKRYL